MDLPRDHFGQQRSLSPIRLLFSLVVCLLSFSAAADENLALASRFSAALERGTLRSFVSLVDDKRSLSSGAWRDVREIVEASDPLAVQLVEMRVDRDSSLPEIRIVVDGAALTRGERPVAVRLPRVWWLTPCRANDGELRVCAARTDASRIVEKWFTSDVKTRDEILCDPTSNAAEIARSLRRRPIRLDQIAAARNLALRLLDVAKQHDDAVAEGEAVLAVAQLDGANGDVNASRSRLVAWLQHASQSPPALLAEAALDVAASAGPDETTLFATSIRESLECARTADDVALEMAALQREALYELDTVQLTESAATLDILRERATRFRSDAVLAEASRLRGLVYRIVHNDRAASASFADAATVADRAVRTDLQGSALLWVARSELRNGVPNEKLLDILDAARLLLPADAVDLRTDIVGSIAILQSSAGEHAADSAVAELLSLTKLATDADARRNAWYAIAAAYRAKKRYGDAVAAATESLRAGQRWNLWTAYYTKMLLAQDLRKLGRTEEALANLRESIELIEARRARVLLTREDSVHYSVDKAENYWVLADLLIETGSITEALETIERGRASTLRDLQYGLPRSAPLSPVDVAWRRSIEYPVAEANRKVVVAKNAKERRAAREELQKRRLELERAQTEWVVRHPQQAIRQVIPSSPLSSRSYIPERNLAILEYAAGKTHSLLFIVTRDTARSRVRIIRIAAGREELARAVKEFRARLDARDFGYHAEARRLYELLLAPAERLIGTRDLCIIPDEALWELPFQVLEPSPGAPLLLSRAVSYTPSIAMLEAVERRNGPRIRPESIVAFGDPLGSLPESQTEVNDIGRWYRTSRVLVGDKASEAAVKHLAGQHDVLHFAAHGVRDAEAPMYSALLMAPGQGDDGNLEAREVAQMHLYASVAVLSACDLGSGRVYPGEGLIGMAWAFLAAGCRTAVVSQWSADSRATAKLMSAFHRRLVRGESVARSLRGAALELRNDADYSHPFYWAGYEAIGNADATAAAVTPSGNRPHADR
jgi:CHAT domain-containing protein